MEIHAIAKDQYPRYRSPNGAEAFDKGRILGRYQSGMDQIGVFNVNVSRRRGRGRRAWWPRVLVGSFRDTW